MLLLYRMCGGWKVLFDVNKAKYSFFFASDSTFSYKNELKSNFWKLELGGSFVVWRCLPDGSPGVLN